MPNSNVTSNKLGHRMHGVALAALIAGSLGLAAPASAATSAVSPNWSPRASEKLVKLPSTVFKKSIEHNFRESGLGLAIKSLEDDERLKIDTLVDLKNAIDTAQGETRTELRHQLLAEKRAFIEMVAEKNALKRKHLLTVYLLSRFQSSFDNVDVAIFKASSGRESKYTVKYAENVAAIEKLYARINNHKMNTSVEVEGQALTKSEYVRHLLSESQADMALLNQEDTILGYMAKNVAYDALALSELTLDADLADSDSPGEGNVIKAVNIFLSN